MDISFTIKRLRQAGLTQTRIGEALGMKQTTISDMEAGKAGVKRPSYRVISGLQALAKTYGVPTDSSAEVNVSATNMSVLSIGKHDHAPAGTDTD